MAAEKEENPWNPYTNFIIPEAFQMSIDNDGFILVNIENIHIGFVRSISIKARQIGSEICIELIKFSKDLDVRVKAAVKKFNERKIGTIKIKWIDQK